MAALRRTLAISSENDEPSVAAKRIGGDTFQPFKHTKLGLKDAVRKPLAARSENISTLPESKAAIKKDVAAPVTRSAAIAAAPATKALPVITEKPASAMAIDLPSAGFEDIDALDDDPQLASEYVKEIYQYMRELETRYRINPSYMTTQTGINTAMRTILIDWLVEVHKRFKLVQESLYLTVHILDRFLEVHPVQRAKLQLVGLGCLLVASKYEDTWPPRIGDLIFIADKAYTREEIIAMECLILDKLEYNLGCPMSLNFLRRYSKVGDSDAEAHTLAKYLLEINLLDYDMCSFNYSQQAASALYLSRQVFGQQAWNSTLTFYSGYTEDDITPCIRAMTKVLIASQDSKYQAVRNKFSSPKLMAISVHKTVEAFISLNKAAF